MTIAARAALLSAARSGTAGDHTTASKRDDSALRRRMLSVGVGNWLRRLFSSSREDEAAEREEYGLPARDGVRDERTRFGSFASAETAEAAEEGLDELEAPRDPAP